MTADEIYNTFKATVSDVQAAGPPAAAGPVTIEPETGARMTRDPVTGAKTVWDPRRGAPVPTEGVEETQSPVDLYAGAALPARLATITANRVIPAAAGRLMRTIGTGLSLEAGQRAGQAAGIIPGSPTDVGLGDALNFAVPAAFNAVTIIPQAARGMRGEFTNPADRAFVDFAEQHGIDSAGYADVVGAMRAPAVHKAMINQTQALGSNMGEIRKLQHGQLRDSALDYASRAQREFEATPQQGLADIEAIAANPDTLAPHVLEARRLSRQLAAVGNNPSKAMAGDIEAQYLLKRVESGKNYDDVAALAKPLGSVPPTQALAATKHALEDAKVSVVNLDPTGATLHQLERVHNRLSPTTASTVPSDAFGPTGASPVDTVTPASTPFELMRKLDSDLGTAAAEPAMAHTHGATVLNRVRQAIKLDMQNFADASNVPELKTALANANEFHANKVIKPYRDTGIIDTVRGLSTEPDQLLGRIFERGAGDQGKNWHVAMSGRGQAAARAKFLDEALHGKGTQGAGGALKPMLGDEAPGILKPAQFASALENQSAATNSFFPGWRGDELRNYANTMRHMDEAGKFMENPQTGARLVGSGGATRGLLASVAGGTALGAKGVALGLAEPVIEAGSNRLRTALYMSKAGRNYLLAARPPGPDSAAAQALAARILANPPDEVKAPPDIGEPARPRRR